MAEPFEVNKMLADTYEPKRSNRFLFQFADEALPSFAARTMARPSATIDPVEIHYLNTIRYLAGKLTWNTMAIGLYDPIAPSAAQKVMEWIRLCYENLSGRAGYEAFYKKDFSLLMLDPVGATVEQWDIQGAFITEATFGDLDMASSDPAQIDVTVRMDKCILRY